MTAEQKDKRLFVSTIILVVVHVAGIIGILSPYKDSFLILTPLNLLVSITLLFWNHKDFSNSFNVFCVLTFIIGFTVEWIGVHTKLLFGHYTYGEVLGPKILDIPVIIGVNWLMLIYSVGVVCNKINTNAFVKSFIGAAALVLLDLFIEPVAMKYNFWNWFEGAPSIRNFIDWFIIAFLLLLLFNALKFNKNNALAKALLIVQLIFFVTLSFL
ncbi:hypothetical protein BH10BAC1_BH10BAC1_21270 [soil metagenome]